MASRARLFLHKMSSCFASPDVPVKVNGVDANAELPPVLTQSDPTHGLHKSRKGDYLRGKDGSVTSR
jgi:hypothetical protein